MLSVIAGFIFNTLMGWQIVGDFPRTVKKYLIVVAPHTSNWDLLIGILSRTKRKAKAWYIAKDSIFRWPFGGFFRVLGGVPVDRSKNSNFVAQVVEIFNAREEFNITIAPEGTRSKVDQLKSGFYYIALGAKIPMCIVTLDWEHKIITFSDLFYPTGDKEADFEFILNRFRGVKGKNPENSIFF
jgi:1-acyl-sn-glycerol-3-phosphate acyltransferase